MEALKQKLEQKLEDVKSSAADLAKKAIDALPADQQKALLKDFCAKLASPVSGGADKAPDLQSYAQMLYSKSKEKVIRSIAEDALKALGLGKTENAQRVKIDVIIKKLKEYVPDPQQLAKYGPKFYKSAEEQKRVCDVFAQAINKQYGGVIISSNIPVNERCKQVSEVLHSLIAGMNSEFLGVAADVNRILNNINVVGEVLDSTYNKILSFLDKAEDDELKQYAKTYRQLYADVKAEFDRQQAILANLMNNTITPAKGEIVKLLQENPDFKGLVDDLEQQIGTEGFGRKLASLVSNASGVVYAAEQVDKAMKKIGLSLEQLKSAKDMKDLHAKVVKAIMAKKPDTDELDDMMKAVKVLFENSYNQNEIIEQLSKTKRGAGNNAVEKIIKSDPADSSVDQAPHSASTSDVGSSDASSDDEGFPVAKEGEAKEGGAVIGADNFDEEGKELPPYFRKQSLKKKISDKEKQRKLMFGQFRTLLRDTYNNIINHATQLGPLVGNEIPMSDELEKFINLFSELPALDKENIHIALTGYRRDLVSREQRENFLNEYALVAQSIEPLVSGPHGSIFNGLKNSIEEMIKVVDNFTQTMIKPLTEIHVESPQEVLEKVRNMAARIYTGSGASDREPFMAGDWTTFNRIKLELKYFYSLSIFRKNMAARAQDNQEYAADYVRVLGEESGWLINKINAEFNDLIEKGNPEYKVDVGTRIQLELSPGEQVNQALKQLSNDEAKQIYKNLKLIWTNQQAAKVGMVKAAQAIDLYLKAFTKGIAKDPDSVKSIAAMLDGIQFVAKWFIERSGDNLASLLEIPKGRGVKPNVKIIDSEKGNLVNGENEHYYNKAKPASPFTGIDLAQLSEKQVENLMRFTDKTLKSTRALENLLSVFISVGDKFKDVQPSSETFMNAGQLQNALIDYMRVASFSTYFGPGELTGGQYVSMHPARGTELNITNLSTQQNENTLIKPGTNTLTIQNVSCIEVGVSADNTGALGTMANVDKNTAKKYTNVGFAAIPLADTTNMNFWAYHAWDKRNRRYDAAGWEDTFYDTDLLFLMTIKSIVAKVFTVVDAYRLFNRPTKNRALISSLSPVRTVLGGGAAPVKIIPEAVELYFRLPLLAEWYRDKLGFNSLDEIGADPDEWVLALVPNIDGIWSDLFAVIFDKARQIKEGNYTEGQSRDIIEAINVCYKAYKGKHPKASCRDIIQAFINEVNRAYGYIQQKQVSAFVQERHKNLDGTTDYNEDADPQQYDILNSDNQFKPGPAPSDKFVDIGIKNAKTIRRITMQKLQKKMVDLHNELDVDFLQFVLNNNGLNNEMFSFKDTISNYKKELSLAKSDEQQYQIVLRALQNTERELVYNSDKMIIIQEMLNAPLAILYGIYNILLEINCFLIAGSYEALSLWKASSPNSITDNFKYINRSSLMGIMQQYERELLNNIGVTYADSTSGEVVLLIKLLSLLSDISANKMPMIGISIAESGKINLDFNKIGEFAKGLIADLRSNLMKIKSMFTKRDEIAYFEKYESSSYETSIRSIEEILIEILINDRDECGLPTACSKYLNQTLASYAKNEPELCNSALRNLIYYEDRVGTLPNVFSPVNLSTFPFNVIALRRPTGAELKEDKQALNQVAVANELSGDAYGLNVGSKTTASDAIKDLNRLNGLLQAPCILFESPNTLNTFNIGSHFAAAYNHGLYHNPSDNCIRPITTNSLFFSINKFIHMYIYTNLLNSPDPKIYAPLIEGFMNSAASREIMEGKPFPNVRQFVTDGFITGGITPQNILKYFGSAPYDSLSGGNKTTVDCDINARTQEGLQAALTSIGVSSSSYPGPVPTGPLPPVPTSSSSVTPFAPPGSAPPGAFPLGLGASGPAPSGPAPPGPAPPGAFPLGLGALGPAPPGSAPPGGRKVGVISLVSTAPTAPSLPGPPPSGPPSGPPPAATSRSALLDALRKPRTLNPTGIDLTQPIINPSQLLRAHQKNDETAINNAIAEFKKTDEYKSMDDDIKSRFDNVVFGLGTAPPNIRNMKLQLLQKPPFSLKDFKLPPLNIIKGGGILKGASSFSVPSKILYNGNNLVLIKGMTIESQVSLGCIPESPQESSLLYASTALTIKSLMYSMNLDKTKKRYLFDGLADIPPHLKEKMQINLPMFSKMFQSIIDRAAFFKKFITYNPIGNSFKQKPINEVAIFYHPDDPNKQYATLKKVSKYDNAQMKSYMLAMLNKINDLAVAIKKCCDGVYNELNDKLPYFMELRKDGVAEYKHKTGHYPFAPASFMMLPLIQADMNPSEDYSATHGLLLPGNINGSYAYQLNNGLRVVYNNPNAKFNIEHFPSVKELYNAYIAAFDIGKKISSSEYVAVLEKVMQGTKFLNEFVQSSRLFGGGLSTLKLGEIDIFNQVELNPSASKHNHASYPVLSLRHQEDTINKIIELQDVVDLRIVKEEMVQFIGTPSLSIRPGRLSGNNRLSLRLYNILDMQMSPINFSAFMREIPYTNLINYAYTFDRMTHDFIMPDYLSTLGGKVNKDNVLISATTEATSVKHVLIKFLLHPYCSLENDEYLLLLFGVFAGMNDFGIGRPKFLNDQIFSKVLLTSPYNAILPLLIELNNPRRQLYADNMDYKIQALKILSGHIATGIKAPPEYDPQNNLYVLHENKMASIPLTTGPGLSQREIWENIGKARFDTKIVRNIVWLVTLQLVMRHSITKHLSWIDTPVIRGLKLLDHKITEFDGNKTLAKDEFDSGDYENILE